jgi:heptaprenyl diphosphate synthase
MFFWGMHIMELLKSNLREEIEEIRKQIGMNVDNQVLRQHIEHPPVSQLRIHLLFLYLQQQGLPKSVIRRYIVTSMLIQMALDSHELVSLKQEETLRGTRSRQLTVLAGDYFSSRYYYLLAQIEDVAVIRSLARSIEEINERKLSLYWNDKWAAEEYLQCKIAIEASLLQSFVYSRETEKKEEWSRFIFQMLLIEHLLQEYKACRQGAEGGIYWRLLNEEEGTRNSYQLILQHLHRAIHQCRKLVPLLGNDELRAELKHVIDGCALELDNQNARAEEM